MLKLTLSITLSVAAPVFAADACKTESAANLGFREQWNVKHD